MKFLLMTIFTLSATGTDRYIFTKATCDSNPIDLFEVQKVATGEIYMDFKSDLDMTIVIDGFVTRSGFKAKLDATIPTRLTPVDGKFALIQNGKSTCDITFAGKKFSCIDKVSLDILGENSRFDMQRSLSQVVFTQSPFVTENFKCDDLVIEANAI